MNLDALTVDDTSNYISLKGFKGNQFGHEVVTIRCKANDVLKFLHIDRDVQRELDEIKVAEIGKYIQYGLDGNDIYFSPLVFSARGKGFFDHNANEFNLGMDETMIILDGQHRIKAFDYVKKRLETRGDKSQRYQDVLNFPLTIQIYLELNRSQEKQLFTDINTKASAVNSSLVIMYNQNDLNARLVQEVVNSLPVDLIETRAKVTTMRLMTASTLYKVSRILNNGIVMSSLNLNDHKITEDNYDGSKKDLEEFITLLRKYMPIDGLNRSKYIISTPNIIMAIAYFVHLEKQRNKNQSLESLFRTVSSIDWRQKNSEFNHLTSAVFNKKTKKYNFSSSTKTIREFGDLLSEKHRERRAQRR